MVENSLNTYEEKVDEIQEKDFNDFRKTHNQGVFDAYTKEIRLARIAYYS